MNPTYLGTARVIITKCARNPELGELFAQAVARPVLSVVGEVIANGAAAEVIDVDAPVAARLLVGGLLTYVLLDGLLRPNDQRPPEPGELTAMSGYWSTASPVNRRSSRTVPARSALRPSVATGDLIAGLRSRRRATGDRITWGMRSRRGQAAATRIVGRCRPSRARDHTTTCSPQPVHGARRCGPDRR